MKKLSRIFVLLLAVATAGTIFGSAPASADYADGAPSNGWAIDGTYVYDITRIDDRIYVGGLFAGVLSPQKVATSQPHLAAFDADTGVYDPTFAPTLNGLVQSVEPSADGSVLYVGGAFSTVNGATHRGVVALDPVTGATISGFSTSIDAGRTVHDIEVDGDDLYIGGDFFTVNGVNNPRVARIDATTGAVDVAFRPAPNSTVLDMSIPPAGNRLYIGGIFDELDGVASKKMVALSLPSGALDTTFEHGFDTRVRAIESTDDRVVVADRGPNRIRLSDTAGTEIALISGDGDFQDLELVGRRVIVGSHSTSLNDDFAYSRLQAFHLSDGSISTTFTTPVLAWPGVFTTYASGQDLWVGGKYYKIGTTYRKKLARIQTEAGQTGPSQPLNLVATTPAANQVGLSWTASTDDTGILGYRILKGASQVDFVTAGTTWIDTSNDVGVTHQYHVEAVDLDDNVSQRSDGVLMAATDGTDTGAPTVPDGLVATTVGEDAIDLEWTESFDLVGVDHYDIFRDGVEIGSVSHPVVTFSDTGLVSSTGYSYEVRAADIAGNESGLSTALVVTTLGESQAPTVPTAVTVTGATHDSISLSWTASTDNVAVVSYEVLRDSVVVGTVAAPGVTFTDTGLTDGTAYSYTVRALDAVPNTSAVSAAVTGTTVADSAAPNGTVTSPTHNQELTTSPVTITGNTTDDIGIASANLAIRNLNASDPDYLKWLQSDLTTWGSYTWLPASLVNPGATNTDFSLAVALGDGNYAIQLTARDLVGNNDPTRPWVRFSVMTGQADTVSPVGFIDTPTDNQQLTGTTHTFSGTATDNVGVAMVQIIIKDVVNNTFLRSDGSFGSYQRLSTVEGTPGGPSTTWTAGYNLPAGSYWVKVVAFDTAGNLNQPKPRNDFTVS